MRKAVIYGRVSTTDKQDYGRQVFELIDFAKNNDFEILEVFTEKVTGTKAGDDRTEFRRMSEFIDANGVNTILVTELSRFGRDAIDTQTNVKNFAKRNVNVFFKDKSVSTLNKEGREDKMAKLYTGLMSIFAENEVETLKERIKSGLRYSAHNGGAGGGKVKPYGYKNVEKKLVIDFEEAKVVKEIFTLYQQGLGSSQIAAHLNERLVPTRYQKVFGEQAVKMKSGGLKSGNKFSWSDATIIGMLKNPIYKGERWFAKKTEKVKVDAIVDPVLFDQVQLTIKNRNNRPIRAIKNDNYLKGLVKCGKCGQSYTMHQRKDLHDAAYQCLSMKLKYSRKMDYCGTPAIGIEKLLRSIMIAFNEVLSDRIHAKRTSTDLNSRIRLKKIEIQNSKSETKAIEAKIERLLDSFASGTFTKSQITNLKKEYDIALEKANMILNANLLELTHLEGLKKIKGSKEYLNIDEFKLSIRDIVKKITIDSCEKKIKAEFASKVKNDVMIKITVEDINGNVCRYILSRYSKKMMVLQEHGKAFRRKGYILTSRPFEIVN